MKIAMGGLLTLLALTAGAQEALIGKTNLPDAKPTNLPKTPAVLPGNGASQHPFLYAGEWDTRKPLEQSIFIVRDGKVVWQYSMPLKTATGGNQEFDDATLLSNGNVIFSRMSGAGMVSAEKKLLWDYAAPPGTEIHSCQSIGKDRVLIMRNGNPAQAMIINIATGKIEKEIPIPNTIKGTHGQFRHIRIRSSCATSRSATRSGSTNPAVTTAASRSFMTLSRPSIHNCN